MAPDRQKLIRNAERLVGRGKLNAAIDEYLKVVEGHPDDTTTLNRVGDLYARLQRIGEAIELFKQAAEHFSDEGFFVKAIAIYKKILRLDGSQLEAAESLAGLQARQGLVNDARQQYLAVARGYKNTGDSQSVLAVHRKLVDLEPDDPSHRLHLAELLKDEGQTLEAMEQFGAIAQQLLVHDKVGEAVRVCQEAYELDHSNLNFVSSVVGEFQRAGHDEEAEGFLEFALERNPEAHKIQVEPAVEESIPVPEKPEVEAVEEVAEEEVVEEEAAEPEVYELEIEEEEEFEIELAELEAASAAAQVEEPAKAVEPPPQEEVEVEAEAEAEVEEIEGLKELLIEADVLARYGLEDKALDKYEEAVELAPDHLDSYWKLVDLHIDSQNLERAAELATTVSELARKQGRTKEWKGLRKKLTKHDFEISKGKITAPEIETVAAEAETPATPASETPQESLSWLDEVTAAEDVGQAEAEEVFETESDFFDLASELERELEEEEGIKEELVVEPEEQSLEEIVEGFKKGMAETLSAEDFDTHYNLGIAYREMGLIDEAVSEFQLAAKDNRYLVDCCSLLASCFIEKGFPELAIKWYNEGLNSPIITEDETLGLVYELGDLYLSMGQTEEARSRFVEIYGVNSDYRDVGSKLAELDQA